ncbi:MAG: DinB family protein [Acidobacteria bacterium]|nr:MAG: DinB family protein [Acidobacteriota bacterium]
MALYRRLDGHGTGPPLCFNGSMSLSPALARVEREFQDAQIRAQRLVESVSEDQWNRKPGDGGWSVAECITHLNLTNQAYLPFVREAIGRGKRDRPSVYRLDIVGWLLYRITEPPAGRFKSKTAPGFSPAAVADRSSTLQSFNQLQGKLLDELHAADGLNLGRLKIASPFNRRVRYNLYSCFRILAAHERRHLWQAEQVRSR